jgi:acyltransferase
MNIRLKEIDVIRGITILLVVMGHSGLPDNVNYLFQTFRMPLFFLMSGYLFSNRKYLSNFNLLLKSKITTLLLPYLFACTVFLALFYIRFYGNNPSIGFFDPIIGILYGNGQWLTVDPPLWFLLCLFWSLIFYYLYSKYLKQPKFFTNFSVLLLIGFCGWIISKFVILPWGLDIALINVLFLFIGNQMKEKNVIHQMKQYNRKIILCLFILLVVFVASYYFNSTVNMNKRMYGNLLLFYTGGISGSLLVIAVTNQLVRFKGFVKVFSFMGKESLAILIFHATIGFIVALKINELLFKTGEVHWVLNTVFGVVVSLLINEVVKRIPIFNFMLNGKPIVRKTKEQNKVA